MLLILILTLHLCCGEDLDSSLGEKFNGSPDNGWFVQTADNRLVPWHTVSYKRRSSLLVSTASAPASPQTQEIQVTTPASCRLESDPSVEYICVEANSTTACGSDAPHGAVVRPRCRAPDYTATVPLDEMRCSDGQWNYIAKCAPAATPDPASPQTQQIQVTTPASCRLESDPSVEYICVEANSTTACGSDAPHGAVVQPRCRAPDYTATVPLDEMRCSDGQWNYIAKCSPAATPDPASPQTQQIQVTTPASCRLESDPSVEYICVEANSTTACGSDAPHGAVVQPRCRAPDYTATVPLDEMRCSDGQWNYIAKCAPALTQAPPQPRSMPIQDETPPGCSLESDPSVEYICVEANVTAPCGSDAPHGAVVRPRCRAPDYTATVPLDEMRCSDGQWNYIAKCAPVCGREHFGPGITNTWFVVEESHGLVPWHTVIYKLRNITLTNETSPVMVSVLPDFPNGTDTAEVMVPVCTGSLISSNIIISSQACFVDQLDQPGLFQVSAGKVNRAWILENDSKREFYSQTSPVKSIHLPSNPNSDISVVMTKNAFSLGRYVRPICLNFQEEMDNQLLKQEANCRMADWDPEQQRSIINLLFLYQDCSNFTVAQQQPYKDLACAVFPVVGFGCIDDSGGTGLAFRDENQQYYLGGVASVGPNPELTCDKANIFLFTHVRKYERFIKQYWDEPLTGKCVLPPYPGHGTYNAYVSDGARARNIPDARPGRSFELVTLNITCAPEHGLTGASSISCLNGVWSDEFPKQCVRMCRLEPHHSVEYRCIVSGTVRGTRACDLYEPPGTVVSPRCRDPIYYSSTTVAFMRCNNGHWNYVATCTPECGRVTPSGAVLVVGGVPAKKGELPWHAGIYIKTSEPYKQICGGSLISNRVIISAAHCFWSDIEKQLPASLFAVAVGKLYRPWNDPMDEAQKSDVAEIHIPTRFQGAAANFQEDIAAVIVEEPFEYKTFVRPVCLSFDINFERIQLQPFNSGKVAGWGLTAAEGAASPVLRVVEMPYVDIGTCLVSSPPDFRAYITSDKICAGSLHSNISLCRGDSGGGLTLPELDKGLERYYLRGVVSAAPRDSAACNTRAYATFTQIHAHETFIKQFLELS